MNLPEALRFPSLRFNPVIAGFLVLALFAGLVAASGNIMIAVFLAGLVVGPLLLKRLELVIWMLLFGTFLINGIITLALPHMTKLAWLFSLLGFSLTAAALMRWRAGSVGLPMFITILLVMAGIGAVVTLLGKGGPLELLVGTKRMYQLWGLMIALALMPVDGKTSTQMHWWLKFLFVVALLQLPFALFQRVVLVPLRVGMGDGVVPIDVVSGTFEASLEGAGSNAVMVMFLICALAYVLMRWKQGRLSGIRTAVLVTLMGAPLFLGETKIVVVLLPMMMALVYGSELRRNPAMALVMITLGLILTLILGWVYLSMLAAGGVTPEQQLQRAIDYNFGSVGYYDRYSLNRTTATAFWFSQHGWHNPIETIFGHGTGSSYAGAGSLVPGHLNKQYPFMAINLTAISTLLWDIGLFGTSLFVASFVMAWRASTRISEGVQSDEWRAIVVTLRVSLASNAFMILYSNSMLSGMSHEAILAFTFGCLAWLERCRRSGTLASM